VPEIKPRVLHMVDKQVLSHWTIPAVFIFLSVMTLGECPAAPTVKVLVISCDKCWGTQSGPIHHLNDNLKGPAIPVFCLFCLLRLPPWNVAEAAVVLGASGTATYSRREGIKFG
jgi:hypothetical protein